MSTPAAVPEDERECDSCGSDKDLMAVNDARGRFDYWRCSACNESAAEREAERYYGGDVATLQERQVEARKWK